MRNLLGRHLARLSECTSGNAALLVALGLPVLIGGAGLGTDLTQWYLWKRELQFAVDQAAVAGAWAETQPSLAPEFVTRATQEYDANLAVTKNFASTPTVELADYSGGTDNSVAVTATATKSLPFSSLFTKGPVTIWAYAQAAFKPGQSVSACLTATNLTEYGAITIGGSSILTARCGMAALSNNATAITVNGSPTVDVGMIVAAGGIDPYLAENGNNTVLPYTSGLQDPYAKLTPPDPTETQVARTYQCSKGQATTTADVSTTTNNTYTYWIGPNSKNAVLDSSYATPQPSSTTTSYQSGQLVPNGTTAGTTQTTSDFWTEVVKNGSQSVWEDRHSVIDTTYSNIIPAGGQVQADVIPGTYTDMQIQCDTTFAPGVYVIDGGGLNIPGQYAVTGSNVMFVLKNGAYISIQGGANINLTAIQASDLIARGVDPVTANKLAGMLVFEDRNSPGTTKDSINGTSNTILNGTMYFPVSQLNFSGTATVTSQCLEIAANQINITGTTDMSTFCPAGDTINNSVTTLQGTVQLVA